MNKLKYEDSEPDLEFENDIKQSFYRTFQENQLDYLCNRTLYRLIFYLRNKKIADEIVINNNDILKKMEDYHNNTNLLFSNKFNNTPCKSENGLTPLQLNYPNKYENNIKHESNFDIFDSWVFPKKSKDCKDNEKSPNLDNAKQNIDYPLSSLWSGGDNNKKLKRNYSSFNSNGHYPEEIIEKKVKEEESFGINIYKQDPYYDDKFLPQNEKIQFNLFKKPTPMFHSKPTQSFNTNVKLETPIKMEINNSSNNKTKKKEETPSRSSRGLRVLSMKVKDIVNKNEKVTYKEVAECLVNELDLKGEENESSKDEQNIKRRVYDALNVLIAADILKKKGKQVYSEESSIHNGSQIFKNSFEEKLFLESNIEILKQTVNEKELRLQEILLKTLSLKNLISRNMEDDETKNEDKIFFPFIALEMIGDPKSNSTDIMGNSQQTFIKIISKNPFHIYGDIDILLKLSLFKCHKNRVDELFSKELLHYLPQDLFSGNEE